MTVTGPSLKKIIIDYNRNSSKEDGFTLVEVLVALLLAGIVMSSIYSAFQSQQNSYLAQDQVTEMQQNIRAGLNIMVRDIRMAGYDPDGTADASITAATSNTITFTYVADTDGEDNDNDATTDEDDELETISYDIYDDLSDGTDDLGRLASGTKSAVAENIEQLEFYYQLNDGTQTLAPADPSTIRAVQISILARAANLDGNFTNTETYTPASGTPWDLNGASAGNAADDNYRRRLLSVTVQCRNMGL